MQVGIEQLRLHLRDYRDCLDQGGSPVEVYYRGKRSAFLVSHSQSSRLRIYVSEKLKIIEFRQNLGILRQKLSKKSLDAVFVYDGNTQEPVMALVGGDYASELGIGSQAENQAVDKVFHGK